MTERHLVEAVNYCEGCMEPLGEEGPAARTPHGWVFFCYDDCRDAWCSAHAGEYVRWQEG